MNTQRKVTVNAITRTPLGHAMVWLSILALLTVAALGVVQVRTAPTHLSASPAVAANLQLQSSVAGDSLVAKVKTGARVAAHASPTSIAAWAGSKGAVATAELNSAASSLATYIVQHPWGRYVLPPLNSPAFKRATWCSESDHTLAITVDFMIARCGAPWGRGSYFGTAMVDSSSGVTLVAIFAQGVTVPAVRR